MTPAYLQPLFDWIAIHPHWSGLAVFFVAMTESLAVVGIFIPGVVVMFAVGALIAAGVMEFWPVFWWAAAGAVAGDGFSFWLGRRFRYRISGAWPFRKHPQMLQRGVEFFQRHGGKSVLLGRFIGPIRPVIPLVAGMLGMSTARFLSVNIVSGLAWVPAYLLPGILFGASLELASEVAARLAVLLLTVVLLLWLVSWLVRRVFGLLQPHAASMLERLLLWGQGHPWLGHLSATLADPHHPETRGLLVFALLLLGGTWGFALIVGAVLVHTPVAGIDYVLHELVGGLRTPWADNAMVFITQLGDLGVLLPLSVVISLWLVWRRNWPAAVHLLAALGFGVVAGWALKHALHIPRPPEFTAIPGSFSFPSGHTLQAVTTYGFLAVVIAGSMVERNRWIPYSITGLLIAAIALSRLYLEAHWLSDVLGSLSLGLAWTGLLGIAYRRHRTRYVSATALSLTTLGALVLVTAVYTSMEFSNTLRQYTRPDIVRKLDGLQWWETQWQEVAALREDLRGHRDHPITIQWAGPLHRLQEHLRRAGWTRPVELKITNALMFLSPSATLQTLPILPQVHAGQHEALHMVYRLEGEDHQLIARFWPSEYALRDGRFLWVGTVTTQRISETANLLYYAQTAQDFAAPFEAFQDSVKNLPHKIVERAGEDGSDKCGLSFCKVVLIRQPIKKKPDPWLPPR